MARPADAQLAVRPPISAAMEVRRAAVPIRAVSGAAFLRSRAVLDTMPYVGRRAKIYVQFRTGLLAADTSPLLVRWFSRNAVFAGGTATLGQWTLVFEGDLSTAVLEGIFDIEISRSSPAAGPFAVSMAFGIEPDGAFFRIPLHTIASEMSPLPAYDPIDVAAVRQTTGPEPQAGPQVSAESHLAELVQVTPRGIRLQADWAGRRLAVTPEFSAQNEISVGGLFASTFWRGAAGLHFNLGGEKKEWVLNAGWQLTPATRVLGTGAQLSQRLTMPFESGAHDVSVTQYAGAISYQFARPSRLVERVDLNIHGHRSPTREVGQALVFRREGVDDALFQTPLRVAGASAVGFEAQGNVRVFGTATLGLNIGGQRLAYDLSAGRDWTRHLTTGAQWNQSLPKNYRLTAQAVRYGAQETYAMSFARELTRQQFGFSLDHVRGGDGAPMDTQVRWHHSFTWGRVSRPQVGVGARSNIRTYRGRALLDLVSARPASIPVQVLARVDTTVDALRLAAVARDGLPPETRVDSTTAAVTLRDPVTAILLVTRNGVPFVYTEQFVVTDSRLEIRPMAMEPPPPTAVDEYVVTLENGQGGVTAVTVAVSAGSVRIDRITVMTVAKRETPEGLVFAAVHNVPRNTIVASNAVTITGINVPVPITVVNGEYAIDDGAFTTSAGSVINGQTVRVQHRAASATATITTTVLTVGHTRAEFGSVTEADTVPEPFSFPAVDSVERGQRVTSASVAIQGIDGPAVVTIVGGEYSIEGGAFTAAAGTIANGQQLRVRVTASSQFHASTSASVTVGGVVATFAVTTVDESEDTESDNPPDTTPAAFTFASQTGVALNTSVVSNAIIVSGIDAPAAISVSGGAYAINGAASTSTPGTVTKGQTVTVRQTSSASYSTTTTATLMIGGVSGGFSVTTRAADTTPDAFSFTSQTNVALNTFIVSNAIIVSGIEAAAVISVGGGGEYAINGGTYTSSAGTVSNGQTVTVRRRSANEFLTTSTATLTIGGVSGTFTVTTAAPDTTPDAFSFTSQSNVSVGTVVVSNTITISGINSASAVSISGGEYAIQGNNYTSGAGTISNAETIKVRVTASSSFSTATTATVTIGGVSGSFSVTTAAIDTTPNVFSFTAETNVNLNQTRTSNAITVSGINSAASISVSGGGSSQYRINSGSWTSASGTVSDGDTIRVRHTSASTNSTVTTTTLTIGGVSGTFTSTTKP